MRNNAVNEFYVGYLPVPASLRGALRWIVLCAIAITITLVALVAHSQRTPGEATWDTDREVKLSGVLITQPYPALVTQAESGGTEVVLLVDPGKHGTADRLRTFDGKSITVSGFSLSRGTDRLLELASGDRAIEPSATPVRQDPVPARQSLGSIPLRGEIVDSKCFFGAMKPGCGKTHKECATLCIRGGIPPLFIVRRGEEVVQWYLLQDPSGGPIDPALLPLVGDPVEQHGELSTFGPLQLISVAPDSVRRL